MSLELNKIAAAVLVAGLSSIAIGKISSILYHPEINPEQRGYSIAVVESGDAVAAPVAAGPVDIAPLLAAADPKKGEALTKPCVTCHTFTKGGALGIGPNLWGVVGNHRAHMAGYTYSKVFTDMADKTWDFQSLSEYLTNPAKYAVGTKMAFAGLKKPEDRANVIAYLNSLSDKPLPLPKAEEKPAEAPAEGN